VGSLPKPVGSEPGSRRFLTEKVSALSPSRLAEVDRGLLLVLDLQRAR
jgi:hypothetical protein